MDNERRLTADAAHELRTPLAALRAQAQVARGAGSDAERAHALDNVIAGCDRGAHLVDQLLTLARLEPAGFRASCDACDLRELVRGEIAGIVPAALAKAIEVELESGSAAIVSADAPLLRILLRNLLDNAVRYSPPHTTVRVRVGHRDARAFVTITDQGPGVARDERERLGQRFHRLLGTQASGTGLGLSIAKRIAQIHDATITFDDSAEGSGLVVTVSFARRVEAPARAVR
jgi:two-component system sensor histidine kinase QseC